MKFSAGILFSLLASDSAFQPCPNIARPSTSVNLQMPDYSDGTDYAMQYTDINNILVQNKRFVAAMGKEYFDDLGSKHQPKYMWIGCADARTPANELMGEKPGSVFVIRNVANLVVPTDVSLAGALQFAVNNLGVKHIIVCGHYDCGGVRASMAKADVGAPLEMWIRNLRDVYRTHQDELDSIEDSEARHRRMVEINAVEQAINLFKTSVIQNKRVETAKDPTCKYPAPRIHAVVMDPKTGVLTNLDINWEEQLGDISNVYEMYRDVDELGTSSKKAVVVDPVDAERKQRALLEARLKMEARQRKDGMGQNYTGPS